MIRGRPPTTRTLIDSALTRRGYPKADFERRLDDLSVEHPEVVRRYRAARMLVVKEDGDTEMLRKALIEYRTVFVELANADVQMPAVLRGAEAVRESQLVINWQEKGRSTSAPPAPTPCNLTTPSR